MWALMLNVVCYKQYNYSLLSITEHAVHTTCAKVLHYQLVFRVGAVYSGTPLFQTPRGGWSHILIIAHLQSQQK